MAGGLVPSADRGGRIKVLKLGAGLTDQLDATEADLEIDFNVLLDGVVLVGTAGSGKTTLTAEIVRQVTEAGYPAVVFDTTGDLTDRFEAQGSRRFSGFEDDPVPHDPRVQLNSVDVIDATQMFYRPRFGLPDDEAWLEEAQALSKALLDVLGYRVRGLTPELALLENIVAYRWRGGTDPSLLDVAADVENPPFDRFGIFEIDDAIRESRRSDLSFAIRRLASTSVDTSTRQTESLDLNALMTGPDGQPTTLIFSFVRRSQAEQRFLAEVLLAKLATWVTSRSNTGEFAALICLDESVVLAPRDTSTLSSIVVRQIIDAWRTRGVGLLLTAEHADELNPDVLERCHTWIVGSTPVARSRNAIVEELDLMDPPVDEVKLDATLKAMRPGQFVVKSARLPALLYTDVTTGPYWSS